MKIKPISHRRLAELRTDVDRMVEMNSPVADNVFWSDFQSAIVELQDFRAVQRVILPEYLHPDTAKLVIDFASALADKLHKAEIKYGYSDKWKNKYRREGCLKAFHEQLTKGDPRDVANYCMFMWYHGWSTAPLPK
ncbi:hypothetical protein [Rahnella perminowiae]|uniref:hypothetical protein n=1 Tax=Rahnella perminowiae TaxID=2816244 RepID=UPI00215C684A|nr:hypothetical protein [Rahnella perminowiae]MCR8998695.1 hypothetical protein [Rahnella perminowiae]